MTVMNTDVDSLNWRNKNMTKSEKEQLESILDDYYSDDIHVDTVAVANTLVNTIRKMIKYKFKN